MRRGLMKSKNMISIQILNQIGAQYGQEFITRFGFDPDKNPPYLTLALGAGPSHRYRWLRLYSVFANGGYKIRPYIISHIPVPTEKYSPRHVRKKPEMKATG